MTDTLAKPLRHPYYIQAPDFRDSSAGVRVLHRLCHQLNAMGHAAFLVGARKVDPSLKTPLLTAGVLQSHRQAGLLPIAVYPEIVTGNPLNARVCVRYMLNKEGVLNGNLIHAGPDDLFFYYSPAFTPAQGSPFRYLRFNTHDLELFKPDPDATRTGPLLYLNRIPPEAIDFSMLPANIEVLSNRTPLPLPELARKLQRADVLYSFENSGTCTLAMLCGCPVVALTHTRFPKLGFTAQTLQPYGGRGYALDDSDAALAAARASIPSFRAALARLHIHTERELASFIELTQDRAAMCASEISTTGAPGEARADGLIRGHCTRHVTPLTVVVMGASNTPQSETLQSIEQQLGNEDTLLTIAPEEPADTVLLRHASIEGRSSRWLALIDDGDILTPHALDAIATLISRQPELTWGHSDACVSELGEATLRLYPPDASPRLLRSGFALPGVLFVRADTLAFAVNQAAGLSADNWRQALPYLLLEQAPASAPAHCAEAWVTHSRMPQGRPGLLHPDHTHPAPHAPGQPKVSILVPSRDQLPTLQRCLTSLFEHTPDTAFEIIVAAHETHDAETQTFLADLPAAAPGRIQVLNVSGAFNFSQLINRAAGVARGRFLLLLNNDTAALHPEWLPRMLAEFDDPTVGIVSPRLLFPDGRVQHAGAVLGLGGAADFPWVGAPMNEPGPFGMLARAREVSAVSGAALMIRSEVFHALNGLDERYAIAFGDFDLCLRARQAGHRCIWTPDASLLHEAGQSLKTFFATPEAAAPAQAAFNAARTLFLQTWLPALGQDPHWNRNLSLSSKRGEAERDEALQIFSVQAPEAPRVMALPADEAGSGHYRVITPARTAMRDGLAATRVAPGYPLPVQLSRLGIETLFSQRQVDDNHLEALTNLRALMPDLRIVMDFDDLLTEVPRHSHHHQSVWPDIERRIAAACRLSNCVTASTEPLAQRLRKYHADVRVVPNGIDAALWLPVSAGSDARRKLRVGWAGGISHAGDLAQIRAVVAELATEVEWVFFGMCLEDIQPHLAEFHHGVPFEAYPAKLASLGLDLAIAPLESNAFNDCKSNLRLLEYGALGIPVIASDAVPYRCGLPVTLIENAPGKWVRAIRERIGERDALRREGTRLREAVLQDWTQEKMLAGWIDAWSK